MKPPVVFALRNITHIAIGNENKCAYYQTLRILCRNIHRKHCFGTLAACINNSLFALVILMNLGHEECTLHLTSALWLITSHIWIGKRPSAPEWPKLLRSGILGLDMGSLQLSKKRGITIKLNLIFVFHTGFWLCSLDSDSESTYLSYIICQNKISVSQIKLIWKPKDPSRCTFYTKSTPMHCVAI